MLYIFFASSFILCQDRFMSSSTPPPEPMEALSQFAGEIGLRLGKYLMTVLGESNYLLGLHPPGDRSRPWIEQIKSAAGAASQLVQ